MDEWNSKNTNINLMQKIPVYSFFWHYYILIGSSLVVGIIFLGVVRWIFRFLIFGTSQFYVGNIIVACLLIIFCSFLYKTAWKSRRVYADEKGLYHKKSGHWIFISWNNVGEAEIPWWSKLNPMIQVRKVNIEGISDPLLFVTSKSRMKKFEEFKKQCLNIQKKP